MVALIAVIVLIFLVLGYYGALGNIMSFTPLKVPVEQAGKGKLKTAHTAQGVMKALETDTEWQPRFLPGKAQVGDPCLIHVQGHNAGQPILPVDRFTCTYRKAIQPGRKQCCCKDDKGLRCLPTFIVLGAQKSGTTALIGYLMLHPNFAPPKNKEIHFFDQLRKFKRGVPWYLSKFPYLEDKETSEVITAEDTPAYISGSHVMHRMIEGLGDVARDEMLFVVMLRNPTSRAYSEYQMHQRRFDAEVKGWRVFKESWAAKIRPCIVEKLKVEENPRNHAHPGRCFLQFLEHFQLSHKLGQLKGPGLKHCVSPPAMKDPAKAYDCLHARITPTRQLAEPAQIFRKQIESQVKCMQSVQGGDVGLQYEQRHCYPTNVTSNTARYHIFRSLYAYQMRRWFEVYSPHRFLFVSNNAMRTNANKALGRLHSFVGLPSFKYPPLNTTQVDALIDAQYPDLDARGNVKSDGKYPPLSISTQSMLDEFFKVQYTIQHAPYTPLYSPYTILYRSSRSRTSSCWRSCRRARSECRRASE
jgi:hypothetical protein